MRIMSTTRSTLENLLVVLKAKQQKSSSFLGKSVCFPDPYCENSVYSRELLGGLVENIVEATAVGN